MAISCWKCCFDYYLLKINKDPDFLIVRTANPNKWPKALSFQSWYNEMPGFLSHACKTCMCKILEITTAGNCNKCRKIINSTCCFINSQLSAEVNCLDKVHFWLNHRMKYGDTLDIVCSQYDYLQRIKPFGQVLYNKKKMNALTLLVLFRVLFDLLGLLDCYEEEIIVNVLSFLSGLSFGCFMGSLKKKHNLTRQLRDDIRFFIQDYNNVSK